MRVPRAVRRLSDPLLERTPVPVLSGPNRGRWWSLASAGHGYATGRRAAAQTELLSTLIHPGDVVWDVGAHHGYVALCAASRVGPTGQVHAFEPSQKNRTMLERHLRWNRASNVHVHPFALSVYDGEACFGGQGTSKTFALGAGEEVVRVCTAASLLARGLCPEPTFVKIDVEGAEADVVAGLIATLPPHARLLIAMHDRAVDEQCSAQLAGAGVELIASSALTRCREGDWVGDPDLFCMGPAHAGLQRDRDLLLAAGF